MSTRFGSLATALAVVVALTSPGAVPVAEAAPVPVLGELVDLGGTGFDMEIDEASRVAYVSIEFEERIAVIDIDSRSVVEDFMLSAIPLGISLSADGGELYVALQDTGSVAELDAASGATLRTFSLGALMEDDRVFDVQVVNDELFVVPATQSSNAGRLVKVDLTSGAAVAVSPNNGFRSAPRLRWDGADSLYLAESHSPRVLYRLDLTDPTVPVVAQNSCCDGVSLSVVAANGSQLLTAGGQEMDPVTLDQLGTVPLGAPASRGGNLAFFVSSPSGGKMKIKKYNLSQNRIVRTYVPTCRMIRDTPTAAHVFAGNAEFVVLSDEGVCVTDVTSSIPTCDGLEPTIIGSTQDDVLRGTAGNDVIVAFGGNDEIEGFGGTDRICAGPGDDLILPGPGDDWVAGDEGYDTVSYIDETGPVTVDIAAGSVTGVGADTLVAVEGATGTNQDDILRGDSGKNTLDGAGGQDLLVGRNGNDLLLGGTAGDVLRGGKGRDVLLGGSHDDLLLGGPGNDIMKGETGEADIVSFASATGPVNVDLGTATATGEGSDVVRSTEQIIGSAFNDTIKGNIRPNVLQGGPGNDTIYGMGGRDTLDGWTGRDTLYGGDNHDVLVGYDGHDELYGEAGNDVLAGELGNDKLVGGFGKDVATFELAGRGVQVDLIAGTATGEGADTLTGIVHIVGSEFSDTLAGNGSANTILGLGGNDTIRGKATADVLNGGAGSDIVDGGAGTDVCEQGESYVSCEVQLEAATEMLAWRAELAALRPR